ncbi:MAG TPA: Calx-beta domain-containing protein, partial [Mycobacteriales bacterium]|nr:Calx-beta domain-containing protein [Mycobacteriales bacterium]
GTLTFPPETLDPQFIVIPVVGNLRHQPNHKVLVHLMNAVQAVLDGIDGVGDIVDDDPVPTISISDVTVGEANSGTVNAVLTVSLSNDTDDVVTVNYSTVDGSALANNDYVPASGTLTFQPGQTSQVITITVNAAAIGELTESFNVDLANVTGATMNKARGVVTITPPTSWVTTTVAEFGAGMLGAGGYLADTAGGEITLAPTVGAEFAGTALPSGWTSSVLQTGGGASVANGMVTVDGASVLSPTIYTAGHTLEFVARFSGAADQNAGFGLTSALLPPFAMFGVKADGQLYARSVAPGQAIETPIPGSWFTAPHRFRIDWNATSVVYWIDGTQRVSHTITYKGATASMKPAITDLTAGGGALTVDWMRMSAYAASGSYTSPVYNAGASVNWQAVSWTADSVAGNSIVVEVRTGNTSTTDASWTAFRAVTSGQAIAATSQYAQYRVTLSTTVSNATPAVKEVV